MKLQSFYIKMRLCCTFILSISSSQYSSNDSLYLKLLMQSKFYYNVN